MKSPWEFKHCGQSGIPVSDLFPHIRECADDLCVVRSMVGEGVDHGAALLQTFTGTFTFTRPSMGSWVLYGLGHGEPESARLHHDQAGALAWRRQELELRLPARRVSGHGDRQRRHEGRGYPEGADRVSDQPGPHPRTAAVRAGHDPDDQPQASGAVEARRSELEARIQSFELAFRMQAEAPEVFDVSGESEATKKLYGLDDPKTRRFRLAMSARAPAGRSATCASSSARTATSGTSTRICSEAHRERGGSGSSRSPACSKI